MKVRISEIPENGLEVPVAQSDAWAVDVASSALEGPVKALGGELELRVEHGRLLVTGDLSAEVVRSCDRCGEELTLEIEGAVDLTYRPVEPGGEGVRELGGAELEFGFYAGNDFDIADSVSEFFALGLPMRVLCDIPGARPHGEGCDADFLKRAQPKQVDPRFAALKNLKFEN